MARPFSDIVDRPEQEFSGPTRASCPGVMFRKCRRKIMTRLETEGAAMSINWIAEMSRISADVSRHERVGTERISNQSRNIGERVRQLGLVDREVEPRPRRSSAATPPPPARTLREETEPSALRAIHPRRRQEKQSKRRILCREDQSRSDHRSTQAFDILGKLPQPFAAVGRVFEPFESGRNIKHGCHRPVSGSVAIPFVSTYCSHFLSPIRVQIAGRVVTETCSKQSRSLTFSSLRL